jgi:hypothetical protein
MTVLRAHFDGKVLVPTQPVDLPIGQELELQVTRVEPASQPTLLQKLAKLSHELPSNPDAPTDAAAQHDHYLYGLPDVPVTPRTLPGTRVAIKPHPND